MSALWEDVALRLGCSAQDVDQRDTVPDVMLVRDFEEYRLNPHPDGQPRVDGLDLWE